MAEAAPAHEPLTLDETARELLRDEVANVLQTVRAPEVRERFAALGAAVEAGRIPAACLSTLEQLLALGIETGRLEKAHGRAADTLARGLYARTPAGRARAEQAAAVTAALEALAGAVIGRLAFAADGPGAHRLTIETDRGEVLLRIDRDGVRVDAVGVGA